jgi:hypothetical protein
VAIEEPFLRIAAPFFEKGLFVRSLKSSRPEDGVSIHLGRLARIALSRELVIYPACEFVNEPWRGGGQVAGIEELNRRVRIVATVCFEFRTIRGRKDGLSSS